MSSRYTKNFTRVFFHRTAWGIAGAYALVSLLWIYFSDRCLLALGINLETLSKIQTWKGSGFVVVTALLLFALLHSAIKKAQYGEALFRNVIETIPMGIWVVDPQGKIIDLNCAAQRILDNFGIQNYDDVEGYANVRGWWYDSGQQVAAEEWGVSRALIKGETCLAEKIIIDCRDGIQRTILYSALPLKFENGDSAGAVTLVEDITEKMKTDNALRQFRFSMEQASEGIFWIDPAGGFSFVNDQACHSLGYSQEELRHLHLWDIDPDYPPERWAVQWQDLKKSGRKVFETFHQRKDGSKFPVEVSASQCFFDKQEYHVAFVRDISIRKEIQKQLEHQSNHDALTGLANRVLLDDRIAQSIARAERIGGYVAVFLLDLDRFKIINDSLGHSQGDTILVKVSERLAACVRPGDTLSRLGGDEFAIVMPDLTTTAEIRLMAQKILMAFDTPFTLGERELRITTSMGASLYPRDGLHGEDLIRHADTAMYQAKSHGGNSFQFCSQEMDARAHRALELEADLRLALVRDEFILHYQPKINLSRNEIDGCEALVRWTHPDKGMISPGDFIPLAEETGLIVALGTWVLREACRQFKAWQAEGLPPIRIAVNLSARQFLQDDFVLNVKQILTEFAMDPRWLELELTESMVMQDPDKVAIILAQLKEIGFSLSLDDFGTGYSSLNYLRRFPIDYLKIDRSFILDVASDSTAASVANSVIGIAHSLGIHAIAEGVETREQLAFLAQCKCDSIQGFLFSKPLPAAELAQLLTEKNTFAPPPGDLD
ncbi:MAG: GGDEF domain-containing protein [Desulfuromonas sp.]|nr:MAG: GGDEF domain-containing protein [Desulfuromonas sp.]